MSGLCLTYFCGTASTEARNRFSGLNSTIIKSPPSLKLWRAKVELAGVEPASKHGNHTLSTCLFLLDFSDLSAAEQPNLPLVPVCFAIGSEQPSD